MAGYKIKGFKFSLDDEPFVTEELRKHYLTYGWNRGDALHCWTRTIWKPEMLFISVNRINTKVNSNNKNNVYPILIDYSKKGLV